MKLNKLFLFIVLTLTISTVNAQYGYGNGYGQGYGNGYGSGRMNRDTQMQDTPQKPKEIPVEVTVAEIMKTMKPELNLDALQEIAIGNILKESLREQGILLKDENTSQEQKSKEIQVLSETMTRKINEYLSPEQRELYKKINEEKHSSKKSKKSKRNK